MRLSPLIGLVGLALLTVGCSSPPPHHESETDPDPRATEVAAIAAGFLEALSRGDTAALSPVLAPEAMLYSVREGAEGTSIRTVSRADFLLNLAQDDQNFLERMWDPIVQVQGRLAMVWTPYDFYLNGEFSHCGIDVFTLLDGGGGWQVTSITYNVVREGCPPSPLGTPVLGTPVRSGT